MDLNSKPYRKFEQTNKKTIFFVFLLGFIKLFKKQRRQHLKNLKKKNNLKLRANIFPVKNFKSAYTLILPEKKSTKFQQKIKKNIQS